MFLDCNVLYEQKKELQKLIKQEEANQDAFIEQLISDVDLSTFNYTIPDLNLKAKATSVSITEDYENFGIDIKIKITRKNSNSLTMPTFYHVEPLDSQSKEKLNGYKTNITKYRDELRGIISEIQDLARKERQVRGKISEKKISEGGMSALLNDSEILSLVQLD